MSINSLLNTAKESIMSYQLAMDLTGTNIANVNTAGYSRQRVILAPQGKVDVGSLRVQAGVKVSLVERLYNQYLDNQLATQYQLLGFADLKSEILSRIEGIFSEREGGLNDLLGRFWDAWSALVINPQGQVERENLIASADYLTIAFRRLDGDLTKVVEDLGDHLGSLVDQINDYLTQIADLNEKIGSYALDRGETNLLRDERYDLINKLSKLIDINYVEDERGAINIFLRDGSPLITGGDTWQLAVKRTEKGSVGEVVYQNKQNAYLTTTVAEGKKGELAALIEAGQFLIPSYREKLDELASKLAQEVNLRHRSGFDLYGNTGGDFFTINNGARDFRVAEEVRQDIKKIAASATVFGDGENARAISSLKDSLTMRDGLATFGSFYTSLIGQIGRDVLEARNDLDHQESLKTQFENMRQATSGVSLDEEMMNLIRFQMAYQAAGRLVTTVNDLLETLMSMAK